MFISLAGALKTLLIAVITGAVAYSMGYINEKYADGSIIPGLDHSCIVKYFFRYMFDFPVDMNFSTYA